MKNETFFIRENSFLARIAAWKLKSASVVLVLGKTIHLYNISTKDFLQDEKLMKHELCHVRQYQQHRFLPFLFKYGWESLRKGYYNNRFEAAARQAESE